MEAPPEGNIEVESCNEVDDDKSNSDCQSMPAYMNSVLRRQYLQEMVKALPAAVQKRITVLKNLQMDHLKLEAAFFEEVYKLERQFQLKYQPMFEKRKEIVSGAVDPAEEKPKWKEPESLPDEVVGDAFNESLKAIKAMPQDAKGIPDFWLTVFRNTAMLSEMVQSHDEPAIRKLTDIVIKYDDEHSYILEFHFEKNEFFSNTVLTKQYFLKSTVDEDDPFAFEGPEIYKCKGCVINWEKKMNLTVKTIRKKQKHKERGAVRTIVKQVPTDSFFNFFNPPEVPTDKEDIDDDSQQILATDFEIGHFLRARIIPKAVLYFTGDIVDDEDDDDEEEYENEDDEYDDDEPEGGHSKPSGGSKKQSPNDCPNQ
ncbi:nucleosome assembly protein 1-like 1-B [Drosophila nasuta]|uniref:Nucleosome assembly protein 1-like 1-B n=1 Tax=Drosophila albomicans TaxID=7291 RepID=A0A6P8WWM0_DROAB|nr:nucleosome assembly protein 1-like 1-B [Drosophila albomicans]XP_060659184.1 nucleosome assembly protein 1-like 1-B [Drosophila nasuta]